MDAPKKWIVRYDTRDFMPGEVKVTAASKEKAKEQALKKLGAKFKNKLNGVDIKTYIEICSIDLDMDKE